MGSGTHEILNIYIFGLLPTIGGFFAPVGGEFALFI